MTPYLDGSASHVDIGNSQAADACCTSGRAISVGAADIDAANRYGTGHSRQADGQLLSWSAADGGGDNIDFQRVGVRNGEAGETDVGQVQAATANIVVAVFDVT